MKIRKNKYKLSNEIAANIEYLKRKRGVDNKELAKAMDKSLVTIYRYLKEPMVMQLSDFCLMASKLNVSPTRLLGDKEEV